jgi:hypothetical protein
MVGEIMRSTGRPGHRIRLVSVLTVGAGALVPLAGAAPAYAQAASTCVLDSNPPTAMPGDAVQLTAVVAGAGGTVPTGTVVVTEGATTLSSSLLDAAGDAASSYTAGSAGAHSITVTYSGDANFLGCSGSTTVTVQPRSTSTTVSSSLNPSAPGQPVTFTATVTGVGGSSAPTGEVTFLDGRTALGSGPVDSNGTASLTTSALATGSHSITASYDGDVNDTSSTSTALTQTVTSPDTDLAISAPAPVTVDATGPSGARVSYPLPAVSDPDDATAPAPSCSPAPGTTFPVGASTVTCTATDPHDTPATVSASFAVTVRGAADQLRGLGQAARGVGPGTSLVDKITKAQSSLAGGDTAGACTTLTGFVNAVSAQSGKSIPSGQAAQLIASATRIRAVLAC